jgi:hypothetical protein
VRICPTAPRGADGMTDLLAFLRLLLRILAVSDHEDEGGGHWPFS